MGLEKKAQNQHSRRHERTPWANALSNLVQFVSIDPFSRIGFPIWHTLQRGKRISGPRQIYGPHARVITADTALNAQNTFKLNGTPGLFKAFTDCGQNNRRRRMCERHFSSTSKQNYNHIQRASTCCLGERLSLINPASREPPSTVPYFFNQSISTSNKEKVCKFHQE
jgi:hypothetical protein